MTERPCNLDYGERWLVHRLDASTATTNSVVALHTDLMCDVEIEGLRARGAKQIRLVRQQRMDDGWRTVESTTLERNDAHSDAPL